MENTLETLQISPSKERKTVDWPAIRDAFLSRSPIPTFTELSDEFGVSISSVSRMAGEEKWPELRIGKQQLKLREAGASEILLDAMKDEGAVTQSSRRFVAEFIRVGQVLLEQIENEKEAKASTRVSTFNNLGFAFANIGRFTESLGIIGLAGRLKSAQRTGEAENGQPWEKGMLQQINVTVKNIQGQAEALAKQAPPVTEIKSAKAEFEETA